MVKTQNIFVFDFEVDQYDWLVRFKYLGQDKWVNIHNSKDALVSFLKDEHASLFIGFNNRNYDEFIMAAILCERDPFEVSNKIIVEGKRGWELGLKRPSLAFLDVKQDNFNNPTLSLKEAEANMGLSIEETKVPFNLGRPWTKDEIMEMAKYCGEDVLGTEKLFYARTDWVNTKSTLIKVESLGRHELGNTNAQLTAKILKADKKNLFKDDNIFDEPDDLKLGRYSNILDYFKDGIPKDFSLEYNLGGLESKLGLGGLHAAIPKFISVEGKRYVFLDVEAFYSVIMIAYNLMSRNATYKGGFLNTYMKRKLAEDEGRVLESKAYKQVLVSTYGAMENPYNNLYDPRMRKNIAITGQLFLIDLIDKIENYCKIIQINTDGLLVEIIDHQALQANVAAWEHRTGFKMTWDYADKIYQKDVNNYFARYENGSFKVKGGYLKQASTTWDGYSRNNMRVVDLALKEYFYNGTDVEEFIRKHQNLNDFQLVVKDKNKMVEVQHGKVIKEHQKVNRLFASNNYLRGEICKNDNGVLKKLDGHMPKNAYVYNGNIMNINVNEINLDYEFYIYVAKMRLNDFGV